jgi:putative Mg2+ transporter-C (MgtC) family protein
VSEALNTLLARTSIPEWELAIRLIVAIALGALIGWEREYKNRPAGLRTHMLVCLASATFAVVALELYIKASREDVHADPIRAIEAVTAGVAFLAAGSIIQARGNVIGLTTGAGLWLSGAIGIAAGLGLYSIAVMAAVFAFVILALLQRLSDRINGAKPTENKD